MNKIRVYRAYIPAIREVTTKVLSIKFRLIEVVGGMSEYKVRGWWWNKEKGEPLAETVMVWEIVTEKGIDGLLDELREVLLGLGEKEVMIHSSREG